MSLIKFQETPNSLLISLSKEGKKEIKDIINNNNDFFGKWLDLTEHERCNGVFEFIHPEHIGALTDAPIIAFNINWDDNGELEEFEDTKYYWFADYMILNEFDILRKGKQVKFLKA